MTKDSSLTTFAVKAATTSAPPPRSYASQCPGDSLRTLQQTIGNRSLQALLRATLGPDDPASRRMRETSPLIAAPSGAAVESPADVNIAPRAGLLLQRACARCEKEEKRVRRKPDSSASLPADVDAATDNGINAIRGGGQPLPTSVRGFFEPRFGYEFSRVRVHTGARAGRSADSVNALAYTVGSDVVLAEGQYAPETERGRKLLAHELTHVVQQGEATRLPHETSPPVAPVGPKAVTQLEGRGAAPRLVVQREEAPTPSTEAAPSPVTQSAPAENGPAGPGCIEELVGPDIDALLAGGGVTVIEFGAEWCGPCQILKRILGRICARYTSGEQLVQIRFFSIDVDREENREVSRRFAPHGVPQMYIYIGRRQRYYADSVAGDPDYYDRLFSEIVADAATSPAARGARTGAIWGSIVGGLLGIAGAIAIGASGALQGNELMGAILGLVAGGAAVGAGLGAGIGALAGLFSGRDRAASSAPAASPARPAATPATPALRPQPKLRVGQSDDVYEQEADRVASEVLRMPDSGPGASAEVAPDVAASRVVDATNLSSAEPVFRTTGDVTPDEDDASPTAGELRRAPVGRLQRLSRRENTALGVTLGTLAGGALGVLAGLGIAALAGGSLGIGALVGGLVGGGIGALVGGLVGASVRRTRPVGAAEADQLIRGRYGANLVAAIGQGASVQGADIRVVDYPAFVVAYLAKNPDADEQRASSVDAFVDRDTDPPRIWIRRDRLEPGILVHEGLHLYSSREAHEQLRNEVHEGMTEYFTRQILDRLPISHEGRYDDQLAEVRALVDLVGEDVVRRAYFEGDVDALDRAVNDRLGRCTFVEWVFQMTLRSWERARDLIERRERASCPSGE